MSETIDTTSTALVEISAALPTILAADKGKDDILGKLAAKIRDFQADGSTPQGREAIRSMAAEVARSKTALVRIGKGLTEDARALTKKVNEECKIIEQRMDGLRDEVRAPLTAWENRDKERVAAHEAALAELVAFGHFPADLPSANIAIRIDELENARYLLERDWQEFTSRASDAVAEARDALRNAHVRAVNREAEQAELTRLRAEQAERDRIAALEGQTRERERIAAEAAEQARREAQAEADRQAREAAEAAQRALDEAAAAQAKAEREAQRQKEVAERLASEAEERRLEGHRQAFEIMQRLAQPLEAPDPLAVVDMKIERLIDLFARDWQEFADQAREMFDKSTELLSGAREVAVRRAEEMESEKQEMRRQQAIEAERARVAKEGEAQRIADKKRADNQAHRAKIDREVLAALLPIIAEEHSGNADEGQAIARAIVRALALHKIPHTEIGY